MAITEEALQERFPRYSLANLPTPLEDAPRLSAALGGPRILIKRDDLTGLALGGNKVRKLEWLLGDALAQGADCLITTGALQSNHCRQTAGAAAKAGLPCYLVLRAPFEGEGQGNVLLDELLGARLIRVTDSARTAETIERLIADLRAEGRKPYLIPVGGSTSVGALGYVVAALELKRQLDERNLSATRVYFSSGSAGTQSGLIVGTKAAGATWQLVGVTPGGGAEGLRRQVLSLARETADQIGLGQPISAEEVIVDDRYVGPGYGQLTSECVEAIRLVAQTEGILLDPVYAGKAMVGLIDQARRGTVGRDETIVFLHTGGTPALFAYAEELTRA